MRSPLLRSARDAALPPNRALRRLAAYHHGLRAVPGAWRGAVALGSLAAATAAVLGAGAAVARASGQSTSSITPAYLLTYNVQIAAIAPISALVQQAVFGVRPRFLTSVVGRFRWRWAGRVATVFVPVWAAYVIAAQLLRPAGTVRLDATTIALTAVVLATTPLQAAGEEYAFRGLVQRSTGSWLASSSAAFALSTLLTAVPFALLHLAKNPWAAAYYLISGLAFSLIARFSGGLEAGVVVHAVGNTLLLLPSVLTDSADSILDASSGPSGPALLAPIAIMAAMPLVVRHLAHRHEITTSAPLPPARGHSAHPDAEQRPLR